MMHDNTGLPKQAAMSHIMSIEKVDIADYIQRMSCQHISDRTLNTRHSNLIARLHDHMIFLYTD